MNKEIYKIADVGTIKEFSHGDEFLNIIADKQIEIATYHDSDCCEQVYGDFSILKYHLESLKDKKVKNIVIKSVDDMGFLIVFEGGDQEDVKIFIPCYNFQNGYYSSNLSLTVKVDEVKTEIDISGCVEDHID